jgi:hypothetical protein
MRVLYNRRNADEGQLKSYIFKQEKERTDVQTDCSIYQKGSRQLSKSMFTATEQITIQKTKEREKKGKVIAC